MKTKFQVTDGANFDSGVIPSGPLVEAPAVIPKREFADPTMAALSGLLFEDFLSPVDRRIASQLISQRAALNTRCAELIEKLLERTRSKAAAAHEAAKAAVREQQGKLDKFREGVRELQDELSKRQNLVAKGIARRDEARNEIAGMSRYSTKAAIDAANINLQQRESACTRLTEEAHAVQSQINQAQFVELKPLMEKMNELIAEEVRLAHAITGKGYTDPSGIVVPERAPL